MKHYKISHGCGEGNHRITSFDSALLDAGVGNYNLVRLSSILPLESVATDKVGLPYGSLLPIAYAVESTNVPDRMISAAIAIGYPADVHEDEERCAVIMEYEGECSKEEAVEAVTAMVCEGFKERGWELGRIEVSADSVRGQEGKWVTAFACVAEWEE